MSDWDLSELNPGAKPDEHAVVLKYIAEGNFSPYFFEGDATLRNQATWY